MSDKKPAKKKHRKLKLFALICAIIIALAAACFLISGWLASQPKLNYNYNTDTAAAVKYPDANFAVVSDLHVYDTALGTTGQAFNEVMYSDRKLLLDSTDLLDFAIDEIVREKPQFVIISGDLTKDGELTCHKIVAEKLECLTKAGIKVYVIPGNHDVNNPDAVSFSGEASTPVDSVTAEEFAALYKEFGYGGALKRDQDSLSYVAEPLPGLWLLAIDSCRYTENKPGKGEIVGGKVSQQTANWIARVLTEAVQQDKAVIVTMHHGVVEHWDGQHKLHPDYLIDDYRHFGEFLASYNVRLAFTGHYHAQDISRADFGDKFIVDIETGSLVTAPCPIRYVAIKNNTLTVKSDFIVGKLHPNTTFAKDASDFVKTTVVREAKKTLKDYFVSDKDADYIANAIGDAFVAHYLGDEDPTRRPDFDKSKLGLWGKIVLSIQGYVLDGLWNDLPPADNNTSFVLGQ